VADGSVAPGGAAGRSPADREDAGPKQRRAVAEGPSELPGEAPAAGTGQLGADRVAEASKSPAEEGAVGPDGIRRTKSGWRKILGLSKDEGR
jgi:hypothetical protein